MLGKIIVRSLLVLLIGLAGLVILNRRFIIGIWQFGGQAREGSLSVGDPAPDVAVWRLDDGQAVRLMDFLDDKPLVLVFGSFT